MERNLKGMVISNELVQNMSNNYVGFSEKLNNRWGKIKKKKIAVAGTGYVGLSIATLLSQHHQVTAVDIVPEKVELINNRKFPIQDEYIEKYLAEKELDLTATLDAKAAYSDAEFVVIAAPTNVYSTKSVEVWWSMVELNIHTNISAFA